MKRSFIYTSFLFLCTLFVYTSCATTKKEHSYVSYSDDRSVLYEIERARSLLSSNSIEALARADALKENTRGFTQVDLLYSDAQAKATSDFEVAVAQGDWASALRIYSSLHNLGYPVNGWSIELIKQRQLQQWKDEENQTLASLSVVQKSTPQDEAPPLDIVSRMIPGTAMIWVDRGMRIEDGVGYPDRVIGSAFFIDPRGYLITNYHVIQSEVDPKYEGFSRLYIKLSADQDYRIPARVIGWDPVLDLALIKTEITPPVVFTLGSSEDLKVGNRIYAIGSPAGLQQTLTSGIVSAQKRKLLSIGDILQIDAPINHGNSGGPIVDEAGRVQAVVFAGIEPFEGLNFAIPVEYLRLILPDLYKGGLVYHPWLAAQGKTATLPGSSDPVGVRLVYSIPGSPLQIAGIPEGTILTAINDQKFTTLEEFQSLILREEPGTIITLSGGSVQADDSLLQRDWNVLLTTRPQYPSKEIVEKDLKSRALLPLMGFFLERVGSTKKYLVKEIIRGSIADESGFSENDVVEIRDLFVDDENEVISLQLYTKRRKSGYLEAFIGLYASLDSPSYF